MASAPPSNKIERAHQMYREGRYQEALGFYTDALAMAKTNPQKIALHSNRAACFLKLHHFDKAAEECTSVLELDQNHTGALMLRAQTLVTLKEYHSALFDVNRLMELNPSSEVYQNLEARLRTQLSLAPIPESEAELEEEEEEEEEEEQEQEQEQEQENENDEEEAEPITNVVKEEQGEDKEIATIASARTVHGVEFIRPTANTNIIGIKIPIKKALSEHEKEQSVNSIKNIGIKIPIKKALSEQEKEQSVNAVKNKPTAEAVAPPQAQQTKGLSEKDPKGWQSIPKPKGHSALDYARWDRVEDDSSEDDDDDDDEEAQPQYRFRLKTVGVRPVK